MPSPSQISVDLPIEVLGGLVTQFDPQKLPMGASPFNQDCSFYTSGGVKTRPGMQSVYAAFIGNPTINYVRTFVDTLENIHQMSLDGSGNVRDEFPLGTLNVIGNVTPGSFIQSDTYGGREWMAVSDGAFGLDIPRQWDGVHFNRVSQTGPGQAPTAVDEIQVYNIAASPNGLIPLSANPTNIVANGGLITFTYGAPLPAGLQVNDVFTQTGALNAAYNVTYTIATLQPNSLTAVSSSIPGTLAATSGGTSQFQLVAMMLNPVAIPFTVGRALTIAAATNATYDGTWTVRAIDVTNTYMYLAVNFTNQAASGGGTATSAGNISAGLHQVSVLFVTNTGFLTTPAIPNSWISAGAKRVILSQIPTGPSNVVARIVIFTPAITPPAIAGPFFYFSASVQSGSVTFPSMIIQDNVTTTATFDFLDAVLENATAATILFNRIELGECSGVVAYSDRVFWTGERNKVNSAGGGGGFNNLSFDGGWGPVAGGFVAGYPLGWSQAYQVATQGGRAPAPISYWGDAYTITYVAGSGAVTGMITQTAAQDYLGVPIIDINTAYSCRVRLKAFPAAGNVPGTLIIELFSPSQGVQGQFATPCSTIPTDAWKEFIGPLMVARASLPPDLQLRVYLSGVCNVGDTIVVDCIEPFPTNQPYNQTIVRCSYAADPEGFDSETGLMIVGLNNGQAVRSMFWLLDNKLYMAKERSLYGTNDDGQNEPDLWTISTISQTVGTPSVNGTSGKGETWGVIASHDGAYVFDGTTPKKIAQEIQPTWDTINWNAGTVIYAVIDTTKRRIHFGAPTGVSAIPNQEFVLDYGHLSTAQDIVDHPQAYYSAYQPTKIIAPGRARKWTLWNLFNGGGANSAAMTVRADGSYHLLRGNAAGTGKIYDQLEAQKSDDGIAINFQYQTYFFPETEQEEALQLGSHRKLVKYLTGFAWGSGIMFFTITGPMGQRAKSLSSLILSPVAQWDFEMNSNWTGERASIIFGVTGQVGGWGELTKLCPTLQRELITPVRGVA